MLLKLLRIPVKVAKKAKHRHVCVNMHAAILLPYCIKFPSLAHMPYSSLKHHFHFREAEE